MTSAIFTTPPRKRGPGPDAGQRRKRGRPSTHTLKRHALLEGATELFNIRGISATSLADVASALGLSRASVYHYVKDRADLVFQCYRHACEVTAKDLTEAGEAKTGLERTMQFIRRALTPERPTTAILTEIDMLPSEQASAIRQASERNTAELVAFIASGIEDNSIRPVDALVAAQVIQGMLAWSSHLPYWARGGDMQVVRSRARECMVDLLTNGLAVERQTPPQLTLLADAFRPTLSNPFDRAESASLKVDQILAVSSQLFNRYGIEATSLEEVAKAMGVTKGVVYHYFDDKADVVAQSYLRAFALYDAFVAAAEAYGDNGLDAALMNYHLNIQAQVGGISPLIPQPGFGSAPEDQREAFRARAIRENHALADLIERGVAEGVARPCDPRMVSHVITGAIRWLSKWLPADEPQDPVRLADKICDLIRLGLRTG
jgi:AcrR family transcriptional regulator